MLYGDIEEYAPEVFAHVSEQGASLLAFVDEEFERYLRRDRLEKGFVRVVCTGCRDEHLVAFSCKRRGWCPSCGARRMVDSATGLVDHVYRQVPIRRWVPSGRVGLRACDAETGLVTFIQSFGWPRNNTTTGNSAGLISTPMARMRSCSSHARPSARGLPWVPLRDARPFACALREPPSRGASSRSPPPPLVRASRSMRSSLS